MFKVQILENGVSHTLLQYNKVRNKENISVYHTTYVYNYSTANYLAGIIFQCYKNQGNLR